MEAREPENAPEPAPQEQELYRFGPMGVGVSFARPGLFVMTQQNNTEIVVTDRRLYGRRKKPRFFFARRGKEAGATVFEVPHDQVLAMERADYLANRALWIRYRHGDGEKEVAIQAGVFWQPQLIRLEAVLRERVSSGPRDAT